MVERTTMVVALVYITCMYICVTRMPEPESFAPVRSLESSLLIVASYHAPVPSRALSPTNGWFTVLRLLPNAPLYTSRASTSKGPIELTTAVLLLHRGYSCKSSNERFRFEEDVRKKTQKIESSRLEERTSRCEARLLPNSWTFVYSFEFGVCSCFTSERQARWTSFTRTRCRYFRYARY